MGVYKQKRSNNWSYRFIWKGKLIRKSTKQSDKRIAETMEAAHRIALAKGEVGIIERPPAPVLADFADSEFLPFIRTTMAEKPNTVRFYEACVGNLKSYPKLGLAQLDVIDNDRINSFIEYRRAQRQERRKDKPIEVSTINRDLATLRRIFNLAFEWGRVSKCPKIRLLSGENRRERVITDAEETAYFEAATIQAQKLEQAYETALGRIRATVRGQQPHKPDACRLRDAAAIMLDAGLRPDECFQLKRENIRDGAIWVFEGKTPSARRRIPIMTERLKAYLEMRLAQTPPDGWLFPAATRTDHISGSTLKKQHTKVLTASGVVPFEMYVLRHTCLTRWGEYMDPWKLHKYAGHADMKTTMRYIHPRDEAMEEAMEQARAARKVRVAQAGHTSGHTDSTGDATDSGLQRQTLEMQGDAGATRRD